MYRLVAIALSVACARPAWVHAPMPDEHHNTIFPTAALRGIRMIVAARP